MGVVLTQHERDKTKKQTTTKLSVLCCKVFGPHTQNPVCALGTWGHIWWWWWGGGDETQNGCRPHEEWDKTTKTNNDKRCLLYCCRKCCLFDLFGSLSLSLPASLTPWHEGSQGKTHLIDECHFAHSIEELNHWRTCKGLKNLTCLAVTPPPSLSAPPFFASVLFVFLDLL
jgi:hypothetical protein